MFNYILGYRKVKIMEEDFRKKFPTVISYPLEMIELAKEAHDEFESYYLYVDFFDGGRLVEVGRGKKWTDGVIAELCLLDREWFEDYLVNLYGLKDKQEGEIQKISELTENF